MRATGRARGRAPRARSALRITPISTAGLIGGGNPPRPGEVTLAHRGVLFLDELPEFGRDALEALRQPLEDGAVRIARARYAIELPCRFQLVAAANPCPCGAGPRSGAARATRSSVRAYEAKLTGALADRIDISLAGRAAGPLARSPSGGEGSAAVRDRVLAARERQRARDRRRSGQRRAARRSEIAIGAEIERLLAEAGPRPGCSAGAAASG